MRLAVVRGEAMAVAGEAAGDGSMLAVLKGAPAEAIALADDHGLSMANDNAPGQVVLSGPRDGSSWRAALPAGADCARWS